MCCAGVLILKRPSENQNGRILTCTRFDFQTALWQILPGLGEQPLRQFAAGFDADFTHFFLSRIDVAADIF